MHGLFERNGLTPETVECFVCYLAGHNRPVHEVLFSRDQDILRAFENEFIGMTRSSITLDELDLTRRRLREELLSMLTINHRRFLLGLVAGKPEWNLMQCTHLAELPSIRWKLQNLAKLKLSNSRKFTQQIEARPLRGATRGPFAGGMNRIEDLIDQGQSWPSDRKIVFLIHNRDCDEW